MTTNSAELAARPRPIIVVLGPSGFQIAQRIKALLTGADIAVLRGRFEIADQKLGETRFFDETKSFIAKTFAAGHPIIGVCAAGILVRSVAPELSDKTTEPPVIAVADDGSAVVPILGGHHGGNDMARKIATELAVTPAITTAGDLRIGLALDAPPDDWILANPHDAKAVTAEILAGEPVSIEGALPWLSRENLNIDPNAKLKFVETYQARAPKPGELIYHPKRIVIGVGSDRGCPPDEMRALVMGALADFGLAEEAVSCVVSLDKKADETAIHGLASRLGVEARFLKAREINAVRDLIPNPSEVVEREVGVPGVAEGAALAVTGARKLAVEKIKSKRATCAIAIAPEIVIPSQIGRARGQLFVVGIGPGTAAWRSAEAVALLSEASDWVGYGLYLDLIQDLKSNAHVEHRFDLGAEELRVRHALALASEGRTVALVCSGDAGIYAMATLVFEVMAVETPGHAISDGARRVEITVAPGISAIQAAAARIGAPIGHDFCCISLSDLLTPWSYIEKRLHAAADGDFVVGFYNPRSMRRRDQIVKAMMILGTARPPDTPVVIASELGRPGERLHFTTMADFDAEAVDMLSIVIVGASSTKAHQTGDGRSWIYTPRGYAAKREAAE